MWEEWFQEVGKTVITQAADAKFKQPYEIERLRLEALGELGTYTEGQAQQPQASGINTTTMLLIGGAVLLLVVMSKD